MTATNSHDHPVATAIDPVCGMSVAVADALEFPEVDGQRYYLCSPDCVAAFDADPHRYTAAHSGSGR